VIQQGTRVTKFLASVELILSGDVTGRQASAMLRALHAFHGRHNTSLSRAPRQNENYVKQQNILGFRYPTNGKFY
jgi:hypothetical protein